MVLPFRTTSAYNPFSFIGIGAILTASMALGLILWILVCRER